MTGLYKKKTVPFYGRGLSRNEQEDDLVQPMRLQGENFYTEHHYSPLKSHGEPEFSAHYGDRSSPNTDATTSVAMSNGWTTGNTTERSSIYSLCEDEFDRKASKKVRQMFEEIDFMLFERVQVNKETLYNECTDWVSHFPHLRIRGKQAVPPKELGFQYVEQSPRPDTASNMLVDVTEQDISDAYTANELAINGRHVDVIKPPQISEQVMLPLQESTTSQDITREEIFVKDGIVEDVIAVDYKTPEDDSSERNSTSTLLYRYKSGLPPVSPQACVKDNIMDEIHDYIWSEVVSWMRDISKAYSIDLLGDQGRSVSITVPDVFHNHESIRPAREHSNLSVSTGRIEKSKTSESVELLDGVLSISIKELQLREKSSLGEVDPQFRPPSSFTRSSQITRPTSVSIDQFSRNLSARMKPGRRLAPLDNRVKTPTAIGDNRQNQMSKEIVYGQGIPHGRGIKLPPLESIDHGKGGLRAMSAVQDKESRLPIEKFNMTEPRPETRPNTTHSHYRSETPLANKSRSMTPIGRISNLSQSGPTVQSTRKNLNITGNGISTLAEGGSPENDLEDTHLDEPLHYPSSMPLKKSKNSLHLGPVR